MPKKSEPEEQKCYSESGCPVYFCAETRRPFFLNERGERRYDEAPEGYEFDDTGRLRPIPAKED